MHAFSPERWSEIDRIFDEALDLPPADRLAYVTTVCGSDAELLAAVRSLVEKAAAAERLIGESATSFDSDLLDAVEAEARVAQDEGGLLGGRIGPYRILRELGRGGMGAVYLAERADGEFEKTVAIKLVKRGMDTDEILRRFRQERRVLASLEHPNIARLYDGGATEDGRPFLVMELVEGEPITSYCDRLALPVEARLALFREVCAALQHAHQRLVVHRDVKPSNILVTTEGTPKLLDFGIAKLLDEASDDAVRTRTGIRILTPEFAAPEQLRGEPVTTASDVFSLGAVLHELLVGGRPFSARPAQAADPDEEAERPSTFTQRRRRGASGPGPQQPDAVATARSTTPERLRRRLRGDLDSILLKALEPDPTRRYQSAQQLLDELDRHLGGRPVQARPPGLGYRAGKFVRRNRAGIGVSLIAAIALLSGLGTAVWSAAETARERDRAELERRAAEQERDRAEQVVGFLVGLFGAADPHLVGTERSDTLRVRDVMDRGVQRIREELTGQPKLQAEMLLVLGRVYANLGLFDPAEELLREALVRLDEGDDDILPRVSSLAILGWIETQRNELTRADSLYRSVLSIYEEAGRSPDSLYVTTLSEHGVTLAYQGRYEEARTLHERALSLALQSGGEGGQLYTHVLANLAMLRHDVGEYAGAEELLRRVYDVQREALRADHPRLAYTLNNLAAAMHYQGRRAEAEVAYQEAVEIARRALGDRHPEVPNYLQNLATLYDDLERFDDAAGLYRESIEVFEELFGTRSPRTALIVRNFGLNRLAVGDLAEAERSLRRAWESFASELGRDHLYTAIGATALGRALTTAGRAVEAVDLLEDGVEVLEAQLPETHYLLVMARSDLGAAYAALGDRDRAEPLLVASYRVLREAHGPTHYGTVAAREYLRRLYLEADQPELARQYEPETVERVRR